MQETKRRHKRRARVDQELCVACGSCVKVCPFGAIAVQQGLFAAVNPEKCVGCGKCAKECPATVIDIVEVEA